MVDGKKEGSLPSAATETSASLNSSWAPSVASSAKEAEVAAIPAAVTTGAASPLSANPGIEVVATAGTSGPATPFMVCGAKGTEVAATPPAVTAGAASSLSANPGMEVDSVSAATRRVPSPESSQTSVLPGIEVVAPPSTATVEEAVDTVAPVMHVEQKPLSAPARVKQILDREMQRRKQAKMLEQSNVPAVVATPVRSNSTPPEVPVESTTHLRKRKVGREEDVEKVAELLASQPPSDDDAEDTTMHYEGSSDFLLAWDEQWSRGFQSSDEEWEEGCDEVEGRPEDDNDDGVSLEIQPSDSESLPSVSKAGDGSRDLWIGEEEMARRFGRPEGWEAMKAEEFLSPCMQEVPKPRGRKPGKGKGKKRAKKSKAAKPADDNDDDDAGHALKKRSSKRAATEPAGPKCAKKGKSSPAPTAKGRRSPAPKASPKRAPKAKKSPSSAPKAKPTVRKAVAKSKATSSYRAPCLDDSNYKAKMSRKSGAYHKALKQARDEGKDEEDCRSLARAASRLA